MANVRHARLSKKKFRRRRLLQADLKLFAEHIGADSLDVFVERRETPTGKATFGLKTTRSDGSPLPNAAIQPFTSALKGTNDDIKAKINIFAIFQEDTGFVLVPILRTPPRASVQDQDQGGSGQSFASSTLQASSTPKFALAPIDGSFTTRYSLVVLPHSDPGLCCRLEATQPIEAAGPTSSRTYTRLHHASRAPRHGASPTRRDRRREGHPRCHTPRQPLPCCTTPHPTWHSRPYQEHKPQWGRPWACTPPSLLRYALAL